MHRSIRIATIVTAALAAGACGSPFFLGQQPSVGHTPVNEHMSERLRERIRTVTIVTDGRRPTLQIDGDYGDYVPSVGEGARAGAGMGARVAGEMIAEDPRALVLMPIILPISVLGGTIVGASAAKIEQELQDFRNSLADELTAEDRGRPMPNEQLAEQFSAHLEEIDGIEAVAEDADAAIKVSVSHIDVITDREDAVVRTYAHATLTSSEDASLAYARTFEYSEHDSLRNWAADDAARWVPYAENARNYFAAAIAADLFETIHVRHVLRPARADGSPGLWSARAGSARPILDWELFLLGGDEFADSIDASGITYELRIFDNGRLVYEARGIPETHHQVTEALEKCRALAWSVRPVYRFDRKTRAGAWMSYRSGFDKLRHGGALQAATETPEFWENFARLRTSCAS
jgi:hypothetical protein